MCINKYKTLKSGYFVFSRKYSLLKLDPLIIESRILNDTIKDLPILPKLSAQLNRELITRSIFGTAAIEGNPLSEEEVGVLIDADTIDSDSIADDYETEITNLKIAYELVRSIDNQDANIDITEELIKKLHLLITRNVNNQENNPGHFRNHQVKVGDKRHGGVYTPPKCLPDIYTLMGRYVDWINSPELKKLYPPIRAALAHYHFGLIHPFGDGNGRTARLIEALIIQSSGVKYTPIMLSNYYYKYLDNFFLSFSKTIKNKDNDVTHFINFVMDAFIEALKELKGKVIYFIRLFSMRDYFAHLKSDKKLTQRQFDFLNILLDNIQPITLQNLFELPSYSVLYRGVSDRTARRDLKKLEKMNILLMADQKQYELNMRVLG